MTFGLFAEAWLAQRDLKPGTRELYRSLLDKQILSTFGSLSMVDITPATVRVWFGSYGNNTPAYRARAYQVLRAVFETAVSDEMIVANPCRVKGGGTHTRVRKVTPATLDEIQALIEAMPARLAVAVPLASFCALRFGEMSELRRKDIDLQAGVLRVRRGVVRVGRQGYIVGQPKSAAGIRDVAVPPHLIPMIKAHLKAHVGAGREALILTSPTGDRLGASCLQRPWLEGPGQGRATGSALARLEAHGGRARRSSQSCIRCNIGKHSSGRVTVVVVGAWVCGWDGSTT